MEILMLKSLALLMCCLVYIAINGTSTVNQANLTSPTESPSPVSLNTATLPMGAWSTGYYLDEVGDQTSSSYVSLTTIGTLSNPVSTGAPLTAKMFVDAEVPPMFADMIDMDSINWRELAAHYMTEAELKQGAG